MCKQFEFLNTSKLVFSSSSGEGQNILKLYCPVKSANQKQHEFYKTNENKTWCVNICFFHMLYPLSLLPFSCSDFEQKDILFHLQSALWVVDITADDFLGFCTQEHIYQHGSNSEWLWCCGVPPPPLILANVLMWTTHWTPWSRLHPTKPSTTFNSATERQVT